MYESEKKLGAIHTGGIMPLPDYTAVQYMTPFKLPNSSILSELFCPIRADAWRCCNRLE